MDKKESPKKDKDFLKLEEGAKPKLSGFSGKIFGLIKFLAGVCLLPFVYSVSAAFLSEFGLIDASAQNYFWAGVITLLLVYLFVWEPAIIYAKGQRLMEIVFTFFRPLVRVAPYLLPIYAIFLFVLYLLFSRSVPNALRYFMFLFGAAIALHLVFGAKTLRSKQEDFLKGNYIFGFSFIYILNIFLAGSCLNFIFDKFSLVNFSNQSFRIAGGIFTAAFNQLFVPK